MTARAVVLASVVAASVLAGCFHQGIFPSLSGNEPEDYVTSDKYTTWVIEIDHVQGHQPSQAALDLLKTRMTGLVDKDAVEVRLGSTIPGGGSPWTADEILELREEHMDAEQGGDTVVTYVAYLDGEYTNGNALGVTVNWDVVGMFPETIDSSCEAANLCFFNEENIERAVLVHEFGHVIGLVNRGVDMVNDHEDAGHQGHSSNENSVMYWAVESSLGLAGLDSIPNQFDADDRADVCNAGGKC